MEIQQTEIEENISSIQRVPSAIMPNVVRNYLISQAHQGKDVHAYRAIGSHTWNLWIENYRIRVVDFVSGRGGREG